MDRNSAIGLTLIAGLLMVYFYWFSPVPPPPDQQQTAAPSTMGAQDSTVRATVPSDSSLAATYGDLSASMKGQESTTVVENDDLRLVFTNKGGVLQEVEVKKYKTYHQQPLLLVTPSNNQFNLLATYQGKEIDLYKLYYEPKQVKDGDTTVVEFSMSMANGASVVQRYKIPSKGHQIGYEIDSKGFGTQVSGENLTFQWTNILRPVEKDLDDTRNNSTITYFSNDDGFDELNQTSTDTETEVFSEPLKWITIKEKFFLASIVAKGNFAGGELQTAVNESDTSVVKRANVKLLIPVKDVAQNTADFKFYFGPNDYQTIGDVAEKFSKNVYLGWPPVYWINKYVIFPVFHFLTKFISNYGVIIIILVILLRIVLLPLSYKSYLSMAKMKVLKPELDEIKERVGEDMTKVQQEQMKLYQQVGVNPISGCVPVLLQMPLIFAMFYLFPASIELRQQPFLWAEDLSTYDSIVRLPFPIPFTGDTHISIFTVLMTAATLLYTWQNNQISSVQGPMKTMSLVMPVVFLFFLNSFSAGLTFYYLVSTLLTFAQQAVIKRFVDEKKIRAMMEENKKKNAAGGGKKSKFMSKLEEAMKASEEARRRSEDERKKKKKS